MKEKSKETLLAIARTKARIQRLQERLQRDAGVILNREHSVSHIKNMTAFDKEMASSLLKCIKFNWMASDTLASDSLLINEEDDGEGLGRNGKLHLVHDVLFRNHWDDLNSILEKYDVQKVNLFNEEDICLHIDIEERAKKEVKDIMKKLEEDEKER